MSSRALHRVLERLPRATFASAKTASSGAIVTRLSGGKIDAIATVAGGGPPQTSLQLNFFGTVATLEGLRPLLKSSAAPAP